MKSFKAFRLDTANHLLLRDGDRVPLTPKGFDVLAYLVEHMGRVVTQDEFLETLPKRGYRFVASVTDKSGVEPPELATSLPIEEQATGETVEAEATRLELESSSRKRMLWTLGIMLVLAVVAISSIDATAPTAIYTPTLHSALPVRREVEQLAQVLTR